MSANSPQQVGASTIASEASHKDATYLPPSELAIKYAKGIHNHQPATPHPSATATGRNPHLIKKVEHFYVRPRWLLVRVSSSDSALSCADVQVETEGGVVGWGEGTLEGHTESVQGSLDDIGRRIIGWDAMNIEDVSWLRGSCTSLTADLLVHVPPAILPRRPRRSIRSNLEPH